MSCELTAHGPILPALSHVAVSAGLLFVWFTGSSCTAGFATVSARKPLMLLLLAVCFASSSSECASALQQARVFLLANYGAPQCPRNIALFLVHCRLAKHSQWLQDVQYTPLATRLSLTKYEHRSKAISMGCVGNEVGARTCFRACSTRFFAILSSMAHCHELSSTSNSASSGPRHWASQIRML